MRKYLYVIAALSLMLTACKKEEQLTTAEKIQKKWSIVSVIDYNYTGTTTVINSIDTVLVGTAIDYAEFRTDNKVYFYAGGSYDTSNYSIVNDNSLVLDGDPYTITELTTSHFVLTYAHRSSSPYYDNVITLHNH